MARILIFVSSIFLACTISEAYAQSFTSIGHGTVSCGTVLRDYEQQNDLGLRTSTAWVNGYLSAINELHPEKGNIAASTDAAARNLWQKNYCSSHPLDTLHHATQALVIELIRRK